MNEPDSGAYLALVEEIKNCTLCPLSKGRTNAVPGEGNPQADIMFIGEAPGFHEDKQGRPFIGAAGAVLDKMLATIELDRSDVYIGNMIKCRPPDNRDPEPSEMATCRQYLDRQIELIDPKVIVTLGRHSFGKFFPGEAISKSRGRARKWQGRVVFPVYHPAATLHNPRLRPILEGDFKQLPDLIRAELPPRSEEHRVPQAPPVAQLGMNFEPIEPDRAPMAPQPAAPDQPLQAELF